MIFTVLSFIKGRFSKDAFEAAKSDETKMTRQEALQQFRNLASKRAKKN